MSYEWHANFPLGFRNRDDLQDAVEGKGRFASVQDLYARLQLLAQSVEDREWNTDAKSWSKREERPDVRGKVEIPYTYQRLVLRYHDRPEQTWYTEYIQERLGEYQALGFASSRLEEADLACLPEHSFFLYVPFTLAAPYVSKDDEPFYVHENPVRKDWVLRVPIVGSTSWKGAFRAALRYHLKADDNHPDIVCLLGNPKGAQEDFRCGRLTFYPTFFNALEVGVINPHSRETGAGKQPIHIEEVPREAKGVFALLYAPIVPDDPKGPLPGWGDVLSDLELVGQATYTLLAELGFGAKTASGMGRAKEEISGGYLLLHRLVETLPKLPSPPFLESPSETFQPDSNEFLDKTGHWPYYATDEELEAHIPGKSARSRYKKQRMAYREWLKRRKQWEAWEQEVARLRDKTERKMVRVTLENLGDLKNLRERVETHKRRRP